MGIVSVGQSVSRFEDPYLLRGEGKFVADVSLPNQTYGFVLRSPHAFAKINSIDTSAALAAPGVLAVLTGADMSEDKTGPLPNILPPLPGIDYDQMFIAKRYVLATDCARMAGHEIAFIIAETLAQAKDAAELVEVDYTPMQALTDSFAVAEGAPRYADQPTNLAFDNFFGDKDATDAAFDAADHVVKQRLSVNRVAPNPIENRATLADYDAGADRWTIYVPTQGPFAMKGVLAGQIFNTDPDKFHLITGNMGGSFGMKGFSVESILTIWAAKRVGRPVKWENERTDSMHTDQHGRDKVVDAELALDKDGNFLGLRVTSVANMGAFFGPMGMMHTHLSLIGLINVYKTPAIHINVKGAYSNTSPTGPYRGSNRPDSTFIMERMVDVAARQLGIDPIDLRRRNVIPADAMPYTMPLGTVYDSGDFGSNMDKALAGIDHSGFAARRAAAEKRGKLLGFGIGNNIEQAVGVGQEFVTYRFSEDGALTIIAGTTDQGQGHPTMYMLLASDQLGIDTDEITVIEGDTDSQAAGGGTGGSRVSVMGSNAARLAGDGIIAKGREIAGHLLEAATTDIEFDAGAFTVAGTDKSVSLADVARASFDPAHMDKDGALGLEEYATYDGKQANYPNGCHVCEIEVDPDTGRCEITRYVAVNDVGTVLNQLTFRGQILGGIGQAVGQALMENVAYDAETGQMLTGSFLDYAMPRGNDFCNIEIIDNPHPTGSNPLGAKGAGEVGCACSMPAVVNGVLDALAPLGIPHLDMPLTADKVWAAIRAAKKAA
ncbi:MAG: xanthine dehydrogenase family protein molybdopterin-binding subunit [Rhodospirillales bacterium]|nr:xanthine dehydrogenase family protein molybdopterin-binding subunit [Rhodospirillales bacterium]